MFGLDLAHMPYRGSGPQANDLVAGHALPGFAQFGNAMPHIAAGEQILGVLRDGNRRRTGK